MTLGELARAEAHGGRLEAAVAAAREILTWTEQSRYLFPNIGMALLFICRLPAEWDLPEMVPSARAAQVHLERLDRQYGTSATAACLTEGKGWVALTDAALAEAAASFEHAAAKWQALGHPYDQARSLSGLGQALAWLGDGDGAKFATERSAELINVLAAQLDDPELKSSFLTWVAIGHF